MLANLDEYEGQDTLHGTTQFWHGPDDDYDICPGCGNEMHKTSRLCLRCAQKVKEQFKRWQRLARRERGRRLVHSWWEGTEVT